MISNKCILDIRFGQVVKGETKGDSPLYTQMYLSISLLKLFTRIFVRIMLKLYPRSFPLPWICSGSVPDFRYLRDKKLILVCKTLAHNFRASNSLVLFFLSVEYYYPSFYEYCYSCLLSSYSPSVKYDSFMTCPDLPAAVPWLTSYIIRNVISLPDSK